MKKINYNKVVESKSELSLYKNLGTKLVEYLERSGPSTLWALVRFVGGSDRRTLRLLDQIVQKGKLNFSNGYFFSNSGKKPTISTRETLCPKCQGRGVVLSRSLKKTAKIMADIYALRPKPTFLFDQRPVTLNTTLLRASYLIWRGDLQGKRIAVIGDDDLTSLAIALSGMAKSITVFEIDRRLIDFLEKQDERFNLNLDIVLCDLTEGTPSKYHNRFDVFLTDPTPAPVPFTAFVNTGLKLLKKTPEKVGYVSMYSSGMEKTLELQKILTKMGLLITDIIPHFTEYEFIKETYSGKDIELLKKYGRSNDRLSFFEHLVRIETTKESAIVPIKFKLKDMLGTAAERVLANPDKDPAALHTNEEMIYIRETSKSMKNNKNREIKFRK